MLIQRHHNVFIGGNIQWCKLQIDECFEINLENVVITNNFIWRDYINSKWKL